MLEAFYFFVEEIKNLIHIFIVQIKNLSEVEKLTTSDERCQIHFFFIFITIAPPYVGDWSLKISRAMDAQAP
jgi:hypothetical protein